MSKLFDQIITDYARCGSSLKPHIFREITSDFPLDVCTQCGKKENEIVNGAGEYWEVMEHGQC